MLAQAENDRVSSLERGSMHLNNQEGFLTAFWTCEDSDYMCIQSDKNFYLLASTICPPGMDADDAIIRPFQQHFSHIRTMGG